VTWLPAAALATLILLASVQCWWVPPRWGPRLREQATLALFWLGAVALVPIAWPLALLLALALWRTRDPHDPAVLTWSGAGLLWAVTSSTPPATRWLLPAAVVTAALAQMPLLGWQGWTARRLGLSYQQFSDALHGSMGSRIYCALLMATALPFAPFWAWPLLIGALLAMNVAAAHGAVLIGLAILYPAAVRWLLPVGLVAGVVLTGQRANWEWVALRRLRCFGDGAGDRMTRWRLLWARFRRQSARAQWLGAGHDAYSVQARWWVSQRAVSHLHPHAHCDPLQFLLEGGVLGLGAVVALVATSLLAGARWGDPLTAAVVGLLVASLIQYPFHLAHVGGPTLILLALLGAA
jgi:hypothetical protein